MKASLLTSQMRVRSVPTLYAAAAATLDMVVSIAYVVPSDPSGHMQIYFD